MTTTIRATCPTCGEVALHTDDVTLVVASQPALSHYTFGCPECREQVRKPADERVVSLLVSGGITPVRWDIPAEALEEHHGPALTYDDLLDFVMALQYVEDLPGRAAQL